MIVIEGDGGRPCEFVVPAVGDFSIVFAESFDAVVNQSLIALLVFGQLRLLIGKHLPHHHQAFCGRLGPLYIELLRGDGASRNRVKRQRAGAVPSLVIMPRVSRVVFGRTGIVRLRF